jgi:ABC-type multidrug transport system fused ATPase/permease subunit
MKRADESSDSPVSDSLKRMGGSVPLSQRDGAGDQAGAGDAPRFAQSGPPAGPGSQEQDNPMRWSVVMRLGRRYLGAHASLVVMYALGSLLITSVLPAAIATRYGALTNFFQSQGTSPTVTEQGDGQNQKAAAPSASPSAKRGSIKASVPVQDLTRTYLFWLVLVLAAAGLGFGQRYASSYTQAKVEQKLQADVYESALRQSLGFYHTHPPGELTMVVGHFTSQARTGLFQLLVDPVVQSVGVVVVGVTLFSALARLGSDQGSQVYLWFGAIAAFAVMAPILIIRLGRKLQQQTSTMQRQDLAIATLVNGSLTTPEEIQAMEAEPIFISKYRKLLAANLRAQLAQTATIERLNLLNTLPGAIVLIVVIGAAIVLLRADPANATPKAIVQLGILTPLLMGMVQSLASFSINSRLSWPAMEAVNEILESRPEVEVAPGALEVAHLDPRIEARNVTFSYSPGRVPNVLDGVSFVIPPGQIVGLVARPGRGKTTIFRLLLRFYDPQKGQLLVGGHPITALTLSSVRRNLALMTQQSAFFHDTVRENFRVAAPRASDDDIQRTAQLTSLWPILVERFGQRPLEGSFAGGQLLSGGQKKLFALTRLLLQRPSIVLFDEPTVGMGPLEKAPLIDVMRDACKGKTVISVDHDILWQMGFCDRFLTLDNGRITQDGTATELLDQAGLFRELYRTASDPKASTAAPMTEPLDGAKARVVSGVALPM